jgi:endonuclease-8
MPEGDTIFKTAAALRELLVGRAVLAARARTPGPAINRVVGSRVSSVEPLGKHLVIHFDNGLALHTHLRLGGSWHRYAPGERWRRPAWQARVVLEVPDHVVVCFNAPVAELLEERAVEHHPAIKSLGPDLLAPSFDVHEAFRRLRARSTMSIAEALLDQRALAGIGNVYKNEILFLERVHPWRTVGELDDASLRRLLATAERLLRLNVQPGRLGRTTTHGDPVAARGAARLWVYGRAGRPCLRCGTRIQSRRQGQGTHAMPEHRVGTREQARVAYWCPACQPR